MRFLDASGCLILDWPRSQHLTPMGWHLSYRFHQPDLEDVLITGLRRWPQVELRNRCEVFALDQDERGVRVRYEDLSSGQLSEIRAAFVVGCDGARSLVRRFIGSGMDDLGFHERWLVIDALLGRDRPDLGDYSIQHCDPRRPATYIRGTANRRRWEITVHPDEDAQAVTQPAKIWELLSRWIAPEEAEIERAAVYAFPLSCPSLRISSNRRSVPTKQKTSEQLINGLPSGGGVNFRIGSIASFWSRTNHFRSIPTTGRFRSRSRHRTWATSGHFSAGHLTRRWHPMTVKRAIAATA